MKCSCLDNRVIIPLAKYLLLVVLREIPNTKQHSISLELFYQPFTSKQAADGVSLYLACTAFFTFVSVSAGKTLPVPPLQVSAACLQPTVVIG